MDGALESGWKGDFNELSTSGSVGIYELYETVRKVSSMLNPAVQLDRALMSIIGSTLSRPCFDGQTF